MCFTYMFVVFAAFYFHYNSYSVLEILLGYYLYGLC